MATSKSDGELVQLARSGAEHARDELVRRYQRQASLLAATLVNDPAEGEDLAQEGFVRAFRNLDLLADPSRLVPGSAGSSLAYPLTGSEAFGQIYIAAGTRSKSHWKHMTHRRRSTSSCAGK